MATRSNPYNSPKNGLKVEYPLAADQRIVTPNVAYSINAAGDSVDLEVVNSSDADYINVIFEDESGAQVPHQFAAPTVGDTATVSLTDLSPLGSWKLYVSADIEAQPNGGDQQYVVDIAQPKNTDDNTTPENLKLIGVSIKDAGSTAVNWDEDRVLKYDETYDLGAVAAGADLFFDIELVNLKDTSASEMPNGFKTFAISTTGSGVGSTANEPTFPANNTVIKLQEVTCATTAGPKTVAVSITSNSTGFEVFKFNLTYTPA